MTNPPPRRALARVRPLDPDDHLPGGAATMPAAPGPGKAGPGDPTTEAAPDGPDDPAGRDLLIPDGARDRAPAARRNGRNGTGGVPSVADLMPPAEPSAMRAGRDGSKGHGSKEHGSGHGGKGSKESAEPESGKQVELAVTIPKSLRKRLKARAAELDMSPEQAAARLIEVWVDG